jgi:streptogramin lyase
MPWRFAFAIPAAALVLSLCQTDSAQAQPAADTLMNSYDIQFPPPAKTPFPKQTLGDISFTRDSAGKVVFTDLEYPTDLNGGQGGPRFATVDSLFQICYGGGYVNPFIAASAAGQAVADYTIAAATAWYQVARNYSNFDYPGGMRNNLQNFTDGWRNDTALFPANGMLSHYNGARGSAASPFTPLVGPSFVPGRVNYSIYASPDNAANGPTPNDSRPLGNQNLGQPDQARQFVILAAWSKPAARHAVNIMRLYDLVTRVLGLPANQVAILYPATATGALGPFPGPINDDPNGLLPPAVAKGPLGTAPINGPNTRASWLQAISGSLFLGGNGQPIGGQAGDKLFVYSTGHGAIKSQFKGAQTGAGNTDDYNLALNDKYNLYITGDLDYDLSVADQAAGGGSLQQNLQLSFGAELPAGTDLKINGNDLGPLDAYFVSNPSQALPIAPFITQPTFTYSLTVPQAFFTDVNNIDFLFTSPGPTLDPALQSLVAIDISGGDQELLVDIGPEEYVINGTEIEAYDSAGNFEGQFGGTGFGNGRFQLPSAITVDSAGNIWVTDAILNVVQEFDSSGDFLQQFGSTGLAPGFLYQPYGIAIDKYGNVWVAEEGNSRIQEFSATGVFLLQVGGLGGGNGQFNGPVGIAIDSSNNIWVADTGNNRIQKFSAVGSAGVASTVTFLLKFGSYGNANGYFNGPFDISVDLSGNAWVADSENQRIQEFNSGGGFIKALEPFSYPSPYGVAADSFGHTWAVDYNTNQVLEFNSSSGGNILSFGTSFQPTYIAVGP